MRATSRRCRIDPSGLARRTILPNSSGRDQAALGAYRVGELLAARNGLAADLTRRVYVILRLNGGDDFSGGDAELRQFVRLHPYAHRILSAEGLHARHALYAGKLILQVDDGVVGEEVRAEFVHPAN